MNVHPCCVPETDVYVYIFHLLPTIFSRPLRGYGDSFCPILLLLFQYTGNINTVCKWIYLSNWLENLNKTSLFYFSSLRRMRQQQLPETKTNNPKTAPLWKTWGPVGRTHWHTEKLLCLCDLKNESRHLAAMKLTCYHFPNCLLSVDGQTDKCTSSLQSVSQVFGPVWWLMSRGFSWRPPATLRRIFTVWKVIKDRRPEAFTT